MQEGALEGQEDLGRWSEGPSLPKPAEEVAATVCKGRIYAVAGLDGWIPMGLMEELDPGANVWRSRTWMPLPAHHVGVATVDDALYVMGGFKQPEQGRGWLPVANTWRYDPAEDRWQPRAPMPTARGAMAVTTHEGQIYVLGGAALPAHLAAGPLPEFLHGGYLVCLSTVEVYDPQSDRWTTRAPMPTPRNHFVVGIIGGRLYAAGGRVGTASARNGSSNIAVTEAYDPGTDTWRSMPTMPTARSGMAAVVAGDRLIVIGGESVRTTYVEVEEFNAPKQQWRALTPMPRGRHGIAAVTVGERVYVLGGGHLPAGADSTGLVEIFVPPGPRG